MMTKPRMKPDMQPGMQPGMHPGMRGRGRGRGRGRQYPCVDARDDCAEVVGEFLEECGTDPAGVAACAATGADFVALREAAWDHEQGPAEAVRQANAVLQTYSLEEAHEG